MDLDHHAQDVAISGPHRPMLANKHQKGTKHVRMAQMAASMKLPWTDQQLQHVSLTHAKTVCMAKTRDVARSTDTWRLMNARDDHQVSDLQEFFKKILAGTAPVPKASDEPLTTCMAVRNGQTSYMVSQYVAPAVKT